MTTKKLDKRQKREIALTILKTLGMVGLVAGVIVFPGLAVIIQWFEKKTGYSSRQVRHSLYNMRKSKHIKLQPSKNGIKVILTPKGRRHLLTISLRELSVDKQSKWDGLWRIVMFDIPEQLRTTRDMIRHHLHRLGFEQMHKSVFINPYPCVRAVDFLRNYYELPAGSLYLFESRVMEGEKELKKAFQITS